MLLLTRKAGDQIAIGADIVVKILEIQGNRVQLGIEAPKHVKIGDVKIGDVKTGAPRPPEPDKPGGKEP